MENITTQSTNMALEVKQPDAIQEVITNYENIGLELADLMLNVANQANSTRRENVTKAIAQCSKGANHMNEMLDGYAKRLQEKTQCTDGTRMTRKNELKQIYIMQVQSDSVTRANIEAIADWHEYVKACRDFVKGLESPEKKAERESKALANKQAKEAKKQAEIEAKKASPLDDAELLQFSEFIPRLTIEQLDLYITILGEVKTAKVKSEKEAKELAEKQAKELAKQQEKERQEKVKALEEALKALKEA